MLLIKSERNTLFLLTVTVAFHFGLFNAIYLSLLISNIIIVIIHFAFVSIDFQVQSYFNESPSSPLDRLVSAADGPDVFSFLSV